MTFIRIMQKSTKVNAPHLIRTSQYLESYNWKQSVGKKMLLVNCVSMSALKKYNWKTTLLESWIKKILNGKTSRAVNKLYMHGGVFCEEEGEKWVQGMCKRSTDIDRNVEAKNHDKNQTPVAPLALLSESLRYKMWRTKTWLEHFELQILIPIRHACTMML